MDSLPLSRRRFLSITAAAPLLLAAARDAPAESADALYAQGVRMLLRGRSFEKAAACLLRAAQGRPADSTRPLALGCAYASRAASLAHAALFTRRLDEAKAEYPGSLARWEAAQRDPQNEDYGDPKPTPPPRYDFPTKDDDRPYKLTPKELSDRLDDLVDKATEAWSAGLALSHTPEDQARAHYIRGWGIRVLRKYLDLPASPEPLLRGKKLPGEAAAEDDFRRAVELMPDDPLYWQAKGDALAAASSAADLPEEAKEAYLKSLTLSPGNANIWYLLYNRTTVNGIPTAASSKEWPPEALEYLHQARRRDRGNAWPLYEEAAILFHFAPYSLTGPSAARDLTEPQKERARDAVRDPLSRRRGRQGIDLLIQGNEAARYVIPVYQDSVPGLLAAAWRYVPASEDFDGFARLRELARAVLGYSQFLAKYERDSGEALRAARAVIDTGLRVCGDWPTDDDPRSGATVLQTLVGIAVVSMGSRNMSIVDDLLGDKDGSAAAQADYDAFRQRVDAYRKTVREHLNSTEFDSY